MGVQLVCVCERTCMPACTRTCVCAEYVCTLQRCTSPFPPILSTANLNIKI
eukprot:NODE_9433_length_225_cov_192.602273_g8273_i0.p2 GENE.NODE_9433_length_225_cov_192.602273_g8273_i0~~NODE_9433_length_225_cov_192.602273_g8273_i0.p2  ORF type:complete len:61 (+),score=37.25 NODE_9433_length_225_cov_192.602273_g8273_i0:33-185(+)